MTIPEAHIQLQTLGQRLGMYNQAERIRGNSVLMRTVGTGMCQGACLEWLRVVLHGLDGNVGPDDWSAAAAQLGSLGKDAFIATRTAKLDALFRDLQTKFNLESDQRVETVNNQLAALATSPGMTQALMDQMTTSAYTLLNETKNAAQAEFDAKFARLQAERMNKGMNQSFWADFAKRMDAALNTGAHSFQSLSTDKAYSKQDVYGPRNGLVALVNRVVDHRKLQAGCGALIVVCPPNTDIGHAVAIHKLNTGRFHLFDPNFGVYEFDNFNVRKAFIFLFLKVYPELMDGTRRAQDSQTYEVNGQVGGTFVIFRPPGVPSLE